MSAMEPSAPPNSSAAKVSPTASGAGRSPIPWSSVGIGLKAPPLCPMARWLRCTHSSAAIWSRMP